jgi:hypothetical protein
MRKLAAMRGGRRGCECRCRACRVPRPRYTTELPQYALLEGMPGLHPQTAHVAAAMTYTLVVLLAVLLAMGPWRPGAGPRSARRSRRRS